MTPEANRPIFPGELCQHLGDVTMTTLRNYIRAGKIPEPCVQITRQQRYWHRTALAAKNILLPEAAPVPVRQKAVQA